MSNVQVHDPAELRRVFGTSPPGSPPSRRPPHDDAALIAVGRRTLSELVRD
jgi:hypothetical protein